jgi:single-strand DNA-binding protein
MNKVILLGRLTRDPESRWTQKQGSQEQTCVARFTLAVDRRGRDQGADFITCVVFGKSAENAEKYLKKGLKIVILSILVDTFISKISFPMQPGPEIGSISDA